MLFQWRTRSLRPGGGRSSILCLSWSFDPPPLISIVLVKRVPSSVCVLLLRGVEGSLQVVLLVLKTNCTVVERFNIPLL